MGTTKTRYVRVPDDLWLEAQDCARAEHTTVSALIRQWLAEYVGWTHVPGKPA